MKITKISAILLITLAFLFEANSASAEINSPSLAERFLLKKYSKNIKKNKDGYEVTINPKYVIDLTNCPFEKCNDGLMIYSLDDVLDDRYALFKVFCWECSFYHTVDLKSGNETTTNGYPNFSPDRKRIFSTDMEMDSDWAGLYELKNNNYAVVFEETKAKYFHSWNGNDEVRVEEKQQLKKGEEKITNLILFYNAESKKWEYREANEAFPAKKNEDDFEKRFPEIRSTFSDKKFILSLLKEKEFSIKYVNKKLLNDKEIIIRAINSDPSNIAFASEKLRDDTELMNLALTNYPEAFKYASKRLKDDRDYVTKVIKTRNGARMFAFASDRLKDNEELLKIAVELDDEQIKNASPRIQEKLKNDKNFAIEMVKINCRTFIHFPKNMRDDKEVMLAGRKYYACSDGGYVFGFASERIRSDRTFLKMLIMDNPTSAPYFLDSTSDKLKKDKAFLMEIEREGGNIGYNQHKELGDDVKYMKISLKKNYENIKWASDRLKNDADFMTYAFEINPATFEYASDQLKEDKNLILKLVVINPQVTRLMSEELKQDRKFLLEMIDKNYHVFGFLPFPQNNEIRERFKLSKKNPNHSGI